MRAEAVFDPSQALGADKIGLVEVPMHPGEGDKELSGSRKDDPRATAGRSRTKGKQIGKRHSAKFKPASDVGRALRSVYDSTLREEVPRDFLDLLGKLD